MYKIIITVVLTYFITHLTKYLISITNGSGSLKNFIKTGGMPSAHSSTVIGLVTIVGLTEGIASTSFAISTLLAIVVIRDAIGVRRSVGEQGLILKELASKNKIKKNIHLNMGHTPIEVIVGSFIGIATAFTVYII